MIALYLVEDALSPPSMPSHSSRFACNSRKIDVTVALEKKGSPIRTPMDTRET